MRSFRATLDKHHIYWYGAGILLGLLATVTPVSAANWPAWRGATGDGVSTETNIPTQWSREHNVRWRVALPEPGNSTPVVWGNRILVTQPVAAKDLRTLMCLDRADGSVQWTATVAYSEKEKSHKTNPYCSASPVTDGERVIVWFGSAGLHCYGMGGKQIWQRDLGKQRHMWGYAASPVIYQDLCILNFGPGNREFVIALDKNTGETVWQVDALDGDAEAKLATPGSEGNAKPPESSADGEPVDRSAIQRGSWSTPLIVNNGKHDELIISHPHRVTAYNPETGRRAWYCRGLGPLVYASPMAGEGTILSMSGYFGGSLAVQPGGSGDVTATKRLWHLERSPVRLGCGVITGGNLYVHNTRSVAQCLDLASGKVHWQQSLKGTSGNNATWASMVLCENNLYLLNQSGDTFVLRAQEEFELLATNSLGEITNSSIVVSNGNIFVRTHEALWCIGE